MHTLPQHTIATYTHVLPCTPHLHLPPPHHYHTHMLSCTPHLHLLPALLALELEGGLDAKQLLNHCHTIGILRMMGVHMISIMCHGGDDVCVSVCVCVCVCAHLPVHPLCISQVPASPLHRLAHVHTRTKRTSYTHVHARPSPPHTHLDDLPQRIHEVGPALLRILLQKCATLLRV